MPLRDSSLHQCRRLLCEAQHPRPLDWLRQGVYVVTSDRLGINLSPGEAQPPLHPIQQQIDIHSFTSATRCLSATEVVAIQASIDISRRRKASRSFSLTTRSCTTLLYLDNKLADRTHSPSWQLWKPVLTSAQPSKQQRRVELHIRQLNYIVDWMQMSLQKDNL